MHFRVILLALFAFSLSSGAVHQVIVGPDGDIVFEPDSLIIAEGDSVVFNKTSKITLVSTTVLDIAFPIDNGFHNIHEANNFFFCSTSCAPTGSGQCSSGCAPTTTQWVQVSIRSTISYSHHPLRPSDSLNPVYLTMSVMHMPNLVPYPNYHFRRLLTL